MLGRSAAACMNACMQAAAVQPPVHDSIDSVSLRSWLNSPWSSGLEGDIYKVRACMASNSCQQTSSALCRLVLCGQAIQSVSPGLPSCPVIRVPYSHGKPLALLNPCLSAPGRQHPADLHARHSAALGTEPADGGAAGLPCVGDPVVGEAGRGMELLVRDRCGKSAPRGTTFGAVGG